MKPEEDRNFFGYAHKIFHEFAQKKPGSVNLVFSRKITHPQINRKKELSITIPLPRFGQGHFFFEGLQFEDNPEERTVMWSLFLASLYHLASHALVSNYSLYEKWAKNKTPDVCNKVIDFIEDCIVENHVSSNHPQIMKNIQEIKDKVSEMGNDNLKDLKYQKPVPKIFSAREQEMVKKIRSCLGGLANDSDNHPKILEIADMLYANRHLLPKKALPYCENGEGPINIISYKKNTMSPGLDAEFAYIAQKLDDLWAENETMRARLIRNYGKHLKGLHFDSVILPSENFYEFAKIRESILPMLKKIRQQLRMIVNVTDSPKTDQMGYLDMQMAIQAIASKGQVTNVFEYDEERRMQEAWVILIDKSASMRLRFDQIKEFAICVAEAANELTGSPNAWAMYSFDNNFQILKDFNEKYGQQIQARLGGLQNSGLSLLPDAIDLSYRVLASDPREKKFLFVITDGHPSGYERINEHFRKIAKKVEQSGILMVAIGVSKGTSKKFKNNARGTDLKQLVAKFITAYRTASSDM